MQNMEDEHMNWISVCKVNEVADEEPKAVEVEDKKIGVFLIEENYFAIENVCPHAFALLTEGFIEGLTVECPLHETFSTWKQELWKVVLDAEIYVLEYVLKMVKFKFNSKDEGRKRNIHMKAFNEKLAKWINATPSNDAGINNIQTGSRLNIWFSQNAARRANTNWILCSI